MLSLKLQHTFDTIKKIEICQTKKNFAVGSKFFTKLQRASFLFKFTQTHIVEGSVNVKIFCISVLNFPFRSIKNTFELRENVIKCRYAVNDRHYHTVH